MIVVYAKKKTWGYANKPYMHYEARFFVNNKEHVATNTTLEELKKRFPEATQWVCYGEEVGDAASSKV